MRSKLNNPEEDTIGPKDAAILLGISASTLWRLTNEGIVPVAGYLRMRSAKPTEEPKFRAVYSRQDLLALKDEWNRMGLSKGKHIKRRYDSGGERPPE